MSFGHFGILQRLFYDCIREYHMANQGQEDGVVLHEKNTGVGSDHEEENCGAV